MRHTTLLTSFLVSVVALAACSGSGSTSTAPPEAVSPPPPPPPPPTQSEPWDEVIAAVEASDIPDLRLIIGNVNGEVFSYEKGSFPADRDSEIASASKLLSGMTLFRLTESSDPSSGLPVLSLTDQPQDYIPWWITDSADARSRVTLEDLLAFKSGFNFALIGSTCVFDNMLTLEDCARQFHDRGVRSEPGEEFFYASAHMTIAGHIAAVASGESFADLFEREIANLLGLSTTRFERASRENPHVAGGANSTPDEYSEILRALLAGEIISDLNSFVQDRTVNVSIFDRPAAATQFGDWHYGLGFWRECDEAVFSTACEEDVIISSPGAWGWTPWVDFNTGYYGLIAMDESEGGLIEAVGDGPSARSVALEQELQPLIIDALAELDDSPDQVWNATTDIVYRTIDGFDSNSLSLDVYEPASAGAPGPVMIMVHGGGWVMGDKAGDGGPTPPLLFPKMPYYVERGWTFVSVNYRLTRTDLPLGHPMQATFPDQPEDLAAAVAWVHENIDQYQGDPDRIVLMGHSAGATMVAQVGTDEAYLGAYGLSLFDLAGVIPLDGFYDVPRQLPQGADYLPLVFTDDPEIWEQASPPNHVSAGKGIPPMLFVYQGVNFNGNSPSHAIQMEELLVDAGIQAEAFDSLKSHADLGSDIGIPGDPLSDKIDEFIASLNVE